MFQLAETQTNRLLTVLGAAALARSLRSILFFDVQPHELRRIAATAAAILRASTEQEVRTVILGSGETDDDLWGNFMLRAHRDQPPAFWQAGLLTDNQDQHSTSLALIPDLRQLSLMATRTSITLMGESVATLERHGQHAMWQPDVFWIAGCASADVGKISAHLLDRFALRLNRKILRERTDRAAEIEEILSSSATDSEKSFDLPPDFLDRLKTATRVRPKITSDAVNRVFSYIATSGLYSIRRDIALGRLAVACAQMAQKREVGEEEVDVAAQLLGLNLLSDRNINSAARETQTKVDQNQKDVGQVNEAGKDTDISVPDVQLESAREQQTVSELARQSDISAEPFPTAPLPVLADHTPYPEDRAPAEREEAPLRLPYAFARAEKSGNGPVIGTERATSFHDLALVRTLIEAAKFRVVRQKHATHSGDRLKILTWDLHSYRREPLAEQMLVLLIDYTSLADVAWEEALFPYLRDAYTERAMICIIKVGAADARHYLRAEAIEARSLLVPAISTAFNARRGNATPLADGLDLAFQALRRHLQHGRGGPYRATLVTLTDGRGNVPLEDSRRGEISGPVRRKGFEDALTMARQISNLDYVRSVFLNPQPQQQAELPIELAAALGAEIRDIKLESSQTV